MFKIKRMQFDASPTTEDDILQVKSALGAVTLSEAIRRAAKICRLILHETQQDGIIKVHRPDGSVVEVKIFF